MSRKEADEEEEEEDDDRPQETARHGGFILDEAERTGPAGAMDA